MKTKYWAFAGLAAGLATAIYYFRSRLKVKGVSSYENIKKQTSYAEKHLRGVMKKAKHAV
jgi:hypothetical protein